LFGKYWEGYKKPESYLTGDPEHKTTNRTPFAKIRSILPPYNTLSSPAKAPETADFYRMANNSTGPEIGAQKRNT